MSTAPSTSIVVGLISGKRDDLRRCLQALAAQDVATSYEILVPYDDACASVTSLQAEFPQVRFIRADGLDTAKARQGFSREHHDTLRTVGIRAALGDIVILTEDHAHAAPSWAREMYSALERYPKAGAVGGAVECDSPHALNWAVWFCDFGRYQNPVPESTSEFVSDSNVAYRRGALDAVADAWKDDYHETAVHWAMSAAGFDLRTTPKVVVWQRRERLGLGEALRERFVWARSFAGTRAGLVPSGTRWKFAALSPGLPILMTGRLLALAQQRRTHLGTFLRVLPLVFLLQTAWACGEFVGYVTGRAEA